MERLSFPNTSLCKHYIIPEVDEDKILLRNWLDITKQEEGKSGKSKGGEKKKKKRKKGEEKDDRKIEGALDRAIGSMMGMAIGDALGAPLEFSAYISPYDDFYVRELVVPKKPPKPKKGKRPKRKFRTRKVSGKEREDLYLNGFCHTKQWDRKGYNKFQLKVGQWTDDAAMGACLADSLLVSYPEFDPHDLRLRFLLWWELGYNNAFGQDGDGRHSVGLGGNISKSMREFVHKQTEYTSAGDRFTSGNGSIMRMCAVPIAFHDDMERAREVAHKQSKTTHQGDEAAWCAEIMAYIIVRAINEGPEAKEDILNDMAEEFQDCETYSITCLAASCKEARHQQNKKEKNLAKNRNWNWKAKKFRYAESRSKAQPGYIGSYAMDGLAMALHCLYTTDNFEHCLLKVVNMRGDADTVGSIAGQMAGAFYGVNSIPKDWMSAIFRWDRCGDFASRAIKLFQHQTVAVERATEEEKAAYLVYRKKLLKERKKRIKQQKQKTAKQNAKVSKNAKKGQTEERKEDEDSEQPTSDSGTEEESKNEEKESKQEEEIEEESEIEESSEKKDPKKDKARGKGKKSSGQARAKQKKQKQKKTE